MFITDIPLKDPSHFLVLNKFPIISQHFILATKEEKEQFAWLEFDDIAITYAVLQEWEKKSLEPGTNKLFAFFNCGIESGASQSHRHIQFLPNASMREGMESIDTGMTGWESLTNILAKQSLPGTVPELPFICFGINIAPEADGHTLYQIYKSLITKASQAIDEKQILNLADGMPYSYNLAMTTTAMLLVPRRHDSSPILTADGHLPQSVDGEENRWVVSLNGTIMAGTLMVKDKELFGYLKDDKSGAIDRILAEACFPQFSMKEAPNAERAEATKL